MPNNTRTRPIPPADAAIAPERGGDGRCSGRKGELQSRPAEILWRDELPGRFLAHRIEYAIHRKNPKWTVFTLHLTPNPTPRTR